MLLLLSAALAQEAFSWDPAVDVPITLAAGVTFGLMYTHAEPDLKPAGVVSSPKGLDALVEPRYNATHAKASDLILYPMMGIGLGLAIADGVADGEGIGTRSYIYLESFAINQLITTTVKLAVDRPRPYTQLGPGYSDAVDELLTDNDSEMSFPSGHASTVACSAFTAARMWDLSNGTRTQRWVGYGSATAVTLAVATLRVTAGKHHPTDVIAGSVLGASVGFLVPTLHATERQIAVTASPSMVNVSGRF